MLDDVRVVVWKEWREVLRMGGSKRRSVSRLIFSIGLLGIIWPWQIGAPFVSSKLAVLFAAFAASMYVAGVVPDSFAGERERHTLETLLASRLSDRAILFGKLAALITYGLCASAIMLCFGWVTVNVVHGQNGVLFYSINTLIAAIAFSIIAAGLMGAAGVLVSLRSPTVKQAQQVLSTAVMILLFLPVVAFSTMPAEWRVYFAHVVARWGARSLAIAFATLLTLLSALLYAIAIARFKRARLILEQ